MKATPSISFPMAEADEIPAAGHEPAMLCICDTLDPWVASNKREEICETVRARAVSFFMTQALGASS